MAIPEARKYTEEEYYAIKDEGRYELIDGYIVDMSPRPNRRHQKISRRLSTMISNYIDAMGGNCDVYYDSDVKLEDGRIVAPDIYVTCDPDNANEQQYLGAPEWVIEIVSPSSISNDYYNKVNLYKDYGTKEYWIVDPLKNHITVHIWDGEFIDISHYRWDEDIPVYFYKDKTPPLTLNIADMLGEMQPAEKK